MYIYTRIYICVPRAAWMKREERTRTRGTLVEKAMFNLSAGSKWKIVLYSEKEKKYFVREREREKRKGYMEKKVSSMRPNWCQKCPIYSKNMSLRGWTQV